MKRKTSKQKYKVLLTKKTKITFSVVTAKYFKKAEITRPFQKLLDYRPGLLVGVPYRGVIMPHITLSDGVMQLQAISIGDEVYRKSIEISKMLKLRHSFWSYPVAQVR